MIGLLEDPQRLLLELLPTLVCQSFLPFRSKAAMPDFDLAQVERTTKSDPKEAAKQFEGLMIQMMVKEMRKTLPENGLFGSDDISMYEDLFDQVISDRIAEGRGFGLAEQLLQGPPS